MSASRWQLVYTLRRVWLVIAMILGTLAIVLP